MNITGFNNKLQATGFEVKKGADKYIDKQYKFYEDGSLKFIDDGLDETFDRSYKYDALGRTTEGKAGIAARGGISTNQHKLDQPYSMSYTHDAFGHITSKTGHYYSSPDTNTYSYNSNDRNPAWSYDAQGNILWDGDAAYTYDAAGRIVKTNTTADYYDGDGQLLKRVANAGSTTAPVEAKSYFVRSSVLNKVISEADATGKKLKTFVPANGTTLATQEIFRYTNPPTEQLTFNHTDASGTGAQTTTANGALSGNTTWGRTGEYSPLGRNIADVSPYITLTTVEPVEGGSGVTMFPTEAGYRPGQANYRIDGLVVPEWAFMQIINSGYIGGAFGLLEIATRMSAARYTVYDRWGIEAYEGTDWGSARTAGYQTETLFAVRTLNDSWSVLTAIVPQAQGQTQTGQPAPLNKKEKETFKKRVDKINKRIQKEKCREFLESKLGNSIVAKISEALANHQAFSGPRSTDITTVEAGILSQGEATRLNGLIESGSPAAGSARYELTRSVAQYFEDNDQYNRKVGAAVGNYNGNPNTAFYRSFDSIKILHEILHIAALKDDNELAEALGVDITPFNGDSDLASNAITETLKANGCKP